MATIDELKEIFKNIVFYVRMNDKRNDNTKWYAGITNNPTKRKKDHERITNVEFFMAWDTGSKENAKQIEKALHDQNFKKGKADLVTIQMTLEGLQENSTFVYVFKNE